MMGRDISVSRRLFLEGLASGAGLLAAERSPAAPNQAQRQWTPNWISGQPEHALAPRSQVSLQPLAQQARNIENALEYLGQSLSAQDRERINNTLAGADEAAAISQLQQILDPHALLTVTISPEARVNVKQSSAAPELVEAGTRLFLVKVLNEGGVTAPLQVQSPNSQPVYFPGWKDQSPEPSEKITLEDLRNRWAEISLYNEQPLTTRLFGLPLQYLILQIYSRDAGQRSASISFDVGSGTQDIGPNKAVEVLFTALPAHSVHLGVRDDDRSPTLASFLVKDHLGRVYPNPSKRLAPDFFFQPQVYRADGESIRLPEGKYRMTCTGGPEYVTRETWLVPRRSSHSRCRLFALCDAHRRRRSGRHYAPGARRTSERRLRS